jgi:hypothetical protein
MGIFAKRYTNPVGMKSGGSVRAPRTANIADQHHKLAYINNEEEALLRARGGTGEKVHGGIPAFRPVKGKNSSGQSSAGTGFSGGSNNNSSSNNNSGGGNPGDIASGGYGTGNSGGYAGGNNGGGQSDNDNEPNRPPVGTGGGNSGGGTSQAEREREAKARAKKAQEDKAKAEKVNKDKADKAKQDAKDKIAAAEKVERERLAKVKELEDQAIRDRIEADRKAQEEADARTAWARQVAEANAAPSNEIAEYLKNRVDTPGGLPEGQLPANNVYAETIVANDSTLGGQSINDLVQKAKTLGLTVKEGEGGLVLVDLTGQEVGKLADIDDIISAVDNNMEDPVYKDYMEKFGNDYESNLDKEAYSDYNDYLKSNPTTGTGIQTIKTTLDGFTINPELLAKYKVKPSDQYDVTDVSPAARLARGRLYGMDMSTNPPRDKDGNIVAPGEGRYLDATDWADGGGPGRAGPGLQTKKQQREGTYNDKDNIGASLGITPLGSGRDPTGVAAYVSKGGILGAFVNGVTNTVNKFLDPSDPSLNPTNTVLADTVTTDTGTTDGGGDSVAPVAPVDPVDPVTPTCPEGYVYDAESASCVFPALDLSQPVNPYTPAPLTEYTQFTAPTQAPVTFQMPEYLRSPGITSATPTQRYLGTA